MPKIRIAVETRIPELHALVKAIGLDERGPVQQRVTDEVARRMPRYMPRQTGALISTLRKLSPTLIEVDGTAARFLFFGVTAKGEPVRYSTERNPQAGPSWDRRLVAAEGAAIARAAERAARGWPR